MRGATLSLRALICIMALSLLCLMPTGQASPLVLTTQDFGLVNLSQKVESLARPEEAWSPAPAMPPLHETFLPTKSAALGQLERGVAWTRLQFDNRSPSPIMAKLETRNFFVHAQLYAEKEGAWHMVADGSAVGGDPTFYEDSGFFMTDLLLAPGLQTFYLRTQKSFPREFYGLRLADPKTMKAMVLGDFVYRVSILGFYLAIFAFVTALWLQFRDPSFTYYLCYVASVFCYFILFSGTFRQFFAPPWILLFLEEWINLCGVLLAPWFANMFAIEYLQLRQHMPRLARLIPRVLLFLYLLLLASYCFGTKEQTFLALNVFGLFYILILLGPGLYLWRQGHDGVRFYLFGWGVFGLGLLIFVLTLLHILPETPLTRWSGSIGVALEMFVLCLALADTFRKREIFQLDRIASLNRSLAYSNHQLQESLKELKLHEISRISMVKDLAHRGNNPLHASTLALDEMKLETSHVQAVLWELLGPEQEADADSMACRQDFQKSFLLLDQLQTKVRTGLHRMSEAIREIRVLSGVDGHHREYFSFEEIIPQVLTRLEEELGATALRRLLWINHGLFDIKLFSNPLVFIAGLERLLRFLIVHTKTSLSVEDIAREQTAEKISFRLVWTLGAEDEVPMTDLDKLVIELAHHLRPYGIQLILLPDTSAFLFENSLKKHLPTDPQPMALRSLETSPAKQR